MRGDHSQQVGALRDKTQDYSKVAEKNRTETLKRSNFSMDSFVLISIGALVVGKLFSPAISTVAMFALITTYLSTLQRVVRNKSEIHQLLRDIKRECDTIKHQKEFELQRGNSHTLEGTNGICIDHIEYSHRRSDGTRQDGVLLKLNKEFYIKPGINVLGGDSGVGKSTFYDLLRHKDDLVGGSISEGIIKNESFSGIKLTDISLAEANKNKVVALQSFEEIGYLTAVDYLKRINPDLTDDYLKKIAKEFDLPLYDYDKEENKEEERALRQMSGGQVKRVQALGAILSPRPILILDEITSGVDETNAERLLLAVNALAKKGKTIIFTTHNVQEIKSLDVSQIFYLEKRQNESGDFLPTDIRIFSCKNEEEKQAYIDFCQSRSRLNSKEKEHITSLVNQLAGLKKNELPENTHSLENYTALIKEEKEYKEERNKNKEERNKRIVRFFATLGGLLKEKEENSSFQTDQQRPTEQTQPKPNLALFPVIVSQKQK